MREERGFVYLFAAYWFACVWCYCLVCNVFTHPGVMDDANNPLIGLLDAVGAITAVPGVDKYAQRALYAIKYQREMGVKVWYVCAYMCVLAGVWRHVCGVWRVECGPVFWNPTLHQNQD